MKPDDVLMPNARLSPAQRSRLLRHAMTHAIPPDCPPIEPERVEFDERFARMERALQWKLAYVAIGGVVSALLGLATGYWFANL